MAGLQRSTVSFRRQGSSGLIWDQRFLSGELTQPKRRPEHAFLSGELGRSSTRMVPDLQEIKPVEREVRPIMIARSVEEKSDVGDLDETPSPKFYGWGCCGRISRSARKPRYR